MNGNKTNSQHAFSLFARLFALDLACFIMSMFVFSMTSNSWLRAAIQLCDLVLLISLIYAYVYKVGEADAVLVNSGYSASRSYRGLIIGCVANIPFFVCAALLVLSRFGLFNSGFYNYYKILNSFFFPFIYTILPIDMTVMEVHAIDMVYAVLVQVVVPLISCFAYLLGLHKFSFKEKLFYRKIEE